MNKDFNDEYLEAQRYGQKLLGHLEDIKKLMGTDREPSREQMEEILKIAAQGRDYLRGIEKRKKQEEKHWILKWMGL
jgi:hypothetical protein